MSKPWQGPAWLLLVLIAINRLLLDNAFGLPGKKAWLRGAWLFGSQVLTTFFLSLFLALCIFAMLKILRRKVRRPPPIEELIQMGLAAQSPYLLAAPIMAIVMAAIGLLGLSNGTSVGLSLRVLFSFAVFPVLYVIVRRRFPGIGELSVLSLVLSPYLLLVGAVFAGLLAIFLFLAAAIVTALLT
ncbi:MAG: hypothetical protein HY401_03095 [Elusimicrobia bacterium]|nr:hypothetical protein [Elusimicrobiota bacterium]